MEKVTVKLYLLDKSGMSPCFGVDEINEIEVNDHQDLQNKIADLKENFAYHLVTNEGFGFSDIVGYNICKNDEDYEIMVDIIS
jgi:hypothetical protein